MRIRGTRASLQKSVDPTTWEHHSLILHLVPKSQVGAPECNSYLAHLPNRCKSSVYLWFIYGLFVRWSSQCWYLLHITVWDIPKGRPLRNEFVHFHSSARPINLFDHTTSPTVNAQDNGHNTVPSLLTLAALLTSCQGTCECLASWIIHTSWLNHGSFGVTH